MPICTDCGTQVDEGNVFCVNCGNIVKKMSAASNSASVSATVSKNAFIDLKKFVLLEGGSVNIGSPITEKKRNDDEGPQFNATISSFYMGKYPVTQSEYLAVMRKNPSNFPGDDHPVDMVCWYDAVEYCNRLSKSDGLSPAYSLSGSTDPDTWGEQGSKWDSIIIVLDSNGYRLPTEAQWEYACRAGTTTPFYTGENITSAQANYNGTSPYTGDPGEYIKKTTPVGSYPPNSWGLYDMHGNVWEWCWDWKENYEPGNKTDPTGPQSGKYRAERGGSWCSGGSNIRSACRSYDFPSIKGYNDGFRLVLPKDT
ncbi:MAG: formylglycine-generating enzyme family protein [Treponema sp.]|nr:formylglycine-generating enzyme family protein [Treponema sp.]